jgi:thiol:disulfide interchange protein DsbC
VWCSPDRNDALTHAKLGEELKAKACPDNPVAHTYQLGKDFALSGTPSIVLPNGDMLSGYEPPDVMIKNLQDATKDATAKR